MQSRIQPLLLCLVCLPVVLISFLGAMIWLSIPLLLQVVIDKVLLQNSPDTLGIVYTALLVTTLMASGLEIGLNGIIATLVRSHMTLKESYLQLAAVLPKVLLTISLLTSYSPQSAIVAAVLTGIACGSCLLLNRTNISSKSRFYPLPLSFRLPLTLVVLAVLWHGASLVLSGQLSLGQWVCIGILSLQFAACLLSFTTFAFYDWKL